MRISSTIILLLSSAVICICDDTVENEPCEDDPKFKEVILKLIVVHAKAGRYDDARRELKLLTDYAKEMNTVVARLYGGNTTKNTHRPMNMLYGISCDAYANGMEALLEEMEKHDHLSEPEILLPVYLLQKGWCKGNEKINQSVSMVTPYLEEIINQWTEDVRNGTRQNITSFFKTDVTREYCVRAQIPKLVERTMNGSTDHFDRVLSFVNEFNYLDSRVVGYSSIVRELTNIGKDHSEEMLHVSYWVYRDMTNNENAISSKTHLAEAYAKVKSEIPTTFQNMIWKSSDCLIRNVKYNEFLDAKLTISSSEVYTSTAMRRGPAGTWILQTGIVNGKLNFHIVSKPLPKDRDHLCHEDNLTGGLCSHYDFAEYKHYVRYAQILRSVQWRLEPTTLANTHQKVFRIKNAHDAEYVYSSRNFFDSENHRRKIKRSGAEDASHWEIDCQ